MRALPLIAGLLLIAPAALADPAMPDPALTPGAVATTDPAVICAPGYARAHRTWRGRQNTMREYDIAPSEWRDYTDDDRVPVCLGGDNASPKNHWAQPFDEALVKDRLEDEMCREVCAGEISLPAAQAIFLGDWRSRLAP